VGSNPTSAIGSNKVLDYESGTDDLQRMRCCTTQLVSVGLLILASLNTSVLSSESAGESAGPWPQFRGPDGLGVSNEPNLPAVWSNTGDNIRWKTKIPGRGNSSPVVSNNRVIVTTAYKSPKAGISHNSISIAAGLLTLAFLGASAGALLMKRRKAKRERDVPPVCRALALANTIFSLLAICVFLFFALLVTVWRARSEFVLARIGFLLAEMGLPDVEHLVSMDTGLRAAVWLTSGGIALLGLAVAVGRIRAESIWRIVSAAAVMVMAIPLVKRTPLDQWTERIEWREKMVFVLPGLIVAFWYLVGYLGLEYGRTDESQESEASSSGQPASTPKRLEVRWKHGHIWRLGGLSAYCTVLFLTALSLLVFVPANFLEAELGMERSVVCVDMATGDLLWMRPVFIAPAERKHADSTYATPTVATDGTHIVADFGVGVACLDYQGELLWKKQDLDYLRNTRYGSSGSPLIAENMAIVTRQAEHGSKRATWVAAFDVETGKTIWMIQPENIREGYSTPTIYQNQLILVGWGSMTSYDLRSGQFLWMEILTTEQVVASLARSGDLLCLGAGTWGPDLTIMMRLDPSNPRRRPEMLWQSELDTPGEASPVIYDGKLFTVSERGSKITCFDALTGTVLWNERIKGPRFSASLVAGDGKVYACSTKGMTTVVAADEEFKVIAQNDLGGRCFASPAIAEGCILLRVGDFLYCIEKEP